MILSDKVLAKEKKVRQHAMDAHIQIINKSTHYAFEHLYCDLPMWERTARTSAYAFDQQIIDVEDDDVVVGRYNFKAFLPGSKPGDHPRAAKSDRSYLFDLADKLTVAETSQVYPGMYTDYIECGLHGEFFMIGHECHSFQSVLHKGWQGYYDLAKRMLCHTKDEKAKEFYQGVIITIEALFRYNDRYVAELERRGMHAQAEICRQVPRYPARNFREAVQCINMVYFTVTQEADGTYGPGWLDYYLWPYLEKDLREGAITEQEAFDLCAYLMIQIDSRICLDEHHNDTICLGGSHPNGASAVNPLTYMFAEAMLQLDITCLLVYLRMPENPPAEFVEFAARYLIEGRNRGQILNDAAIAGALEYRGTPYHEALSYTTNGCMEVSCSQGNSDLLLSGWDNMRKMVEFSITGNRDLVNKKQYDTVHFKGLVNYTDFESYYADFIAENKRLLHIHFNCIDELSKKSAIYRPTYYSASMLNDCMIRGRNMHDGGTRYHDYGTAPVGLANACDDLFAIKKAVFENGLCTAEELLAAIEANYEGYEVLRMRLRSISKYGQDDSEADAFALRYFNDICEIYESYQNRFGGTAKPVAFTFVWAGLLGSHLGATADGSLANTPVSHGTTPASASMVKGATAAILSNCKMPMFRFSGGGSSMWDFDPDWINQDLMQQFISTFVKLGGQMFQGNSSVRPEELKLAQKAPNQYLHLFVRVGGFSARFVDLERDIQDDIIQRCRHTA